MQMQEESKSSPLKPDCSLTRLTGNYSLNVSSSNTAYLTQKLTPPEQEMILEVRLSSEYHCNIRQYSISRSQYDFLNSKEGRQILGRIIGNGVSGLFRNTSSILVFTSIEVKMVDLTGSARTRYPTLRPLEDTPCTCEYKYEYRDVELNELASDSFSAPASIRNICRYFSSSDHTEFRLLWCSLDKENNIYE